jgi:hypothetical protein
MNDFAGGPPFLPHVQRNTGVGSARLELVRCQGAASPPLREVGARRWARQESNLHSRSDPFTAGCSRHMISSPVGCLTGTAPAYTRFTAGPLASWVQAPQYPVEVLPLLPLRCERSALLVS